ncbi:MAG: PKD domain-containing protein, partial [Actinobacteria bacterium]|nr:PKD domain-containing protein [Actinomycetota bacterium]
MKMKFYLKILPVVLIVIIALIASISCCFDLSSLAESTSKSNSEETVLTYSLEDTEEWLKEMSSYEKGFWEDGYGGLIWQSSFAMDMNISQNGKEEGYFEIDKPVSFKVEGELPDRKLKEDGEQADNKIIFSWDLGNGEKREGKEFNYTYYEPGIYIITLTATAGSASDSAITTIWVAEYAGNIMILDRYDCTVEVEVILQNNGPGSLKEVTYGMDIPTTMDPFQQISNIYSEPQDFTENTDNNGNIIYKYYLGTVSEGTSESIKVSYDANISQFVISENISILGTTNKQETGQELDNYLKSQNLIDSDSAPIKDAVEKVVGSEDDSYKIAEKLYNFVVDNFEYDFVRLAEKERIDYKASELLKIKKGVCTDYAILYAALCRAAGIPAKYIGGIPIDSVISEEDKELETAHAWNEIYLPDYGWIPIDPTGELKFLTSNYYLDLRTYENINTEIQDFDFRWTYEN